MPVLAPVKIVPASFEDVKPFFGGLPPYRLQAFAGKIDDRIVGVGGLYYLPDGARVGFLLVTPEGYTRPKEIYKAMVFFLDFLRKEGVPSIRAVADPAIEPAARFLKHFGFKPIETPDKQVVYQWRSSHP